MTAFFLVVAAAVVAAAAVVVVVVLVTPGFVLVSLDFVLVTPYLLHRQQSSFD